MKNRLSQTQKWGASENKPPTNTQARFMYNTYKAHTWSSYLKVLSSLEKVMAPHSSTHAWKISWTEEPGRLQSMGSLRVGHDWATSLSLFMHWRRKWQPTPVFFRGESQGRGSLVGLHRVRHDWSNLAAVAWKIPWMEEPGRLQSMGSLRVGHNWVTSVSLFTFMHWRRKWHPTPIFLPGESQGRGSLVGCRLWGHTELDTTEVT